MPPEVRLLGAPQVRSDGHWRTLPRDKRGALLLFLAFENGWVSRDRLGFLFWPDVTDAVAKRNLRQLLIRVKGLDPPLLPEVRQVELRWPADSDVTRFRLAVNAGRKSEAVTLYAGDLCEGFAVSGAAGWDGWLEQARDDLRTQWRQAALSLAASLDKEGRNEEAAELTRSVWSRHPLDDEALNAYLSAAHAAGQREAALAAFDAYQLDLDRELGLEPLAETLALVERVRSVEPHEAAAPPATEDRPPQGSGGTVQARAAAGGTSSQPGRFIGREQELVLLAGWLADPTCRLLVLTGMGGVGKSRLAAEILRRHRSAYPDGAFFATLTAAPGPEAIPARIASAAGVTLYGERDPWAQLLDALRGRRALLVIDDVERPSRDADALLELVEEAPGVRVVVTSRQELDVHGAWTLRLTGLDYPGRGGGGGRAGYGPGEAQRLAAGAADTGGADGASLRIGDAASFYASEAVQLFLQAAARGDGKLRLDEDDRDAVVRLCQLTEGLPLALELAAAWVRQLSVSEIADEIAGGLDGLSGARPADGTPPLDGAPASDDSRFGDGTAAADDGRRADGTPGMRAVLEHSWRLLSPEQQTALARLSVFTGGFERRAAERVADAGLYLLLSLAGKSLLSKDGSGRYGMHELVRQFAGEKLSVSGRSEETQERHAAHFARVLHERDAGLRTRERRALLLGLVADAANLREAWRSLCGAAERDGLASAAFAFVRFLEWRSEYVDGVALLAAAAEALTPGDPLRAELDTYRGAFLKRSGRPREARDLLREAVARLRETGDDRALCACLGWLGSALDALGAYDEANVALEEALVLGGRAKDSAGRVAALTGLGLVAMHRSDTDSAARRYGEALTLAREAGDDAAAMHLLNDLALNFYRRGESAQAEPLAEESLALARREGDAFAEAEALTTLGIVRYARGDLDASHEAFEASLRAHIAIGSRAKIAAAYNNLSGVVHAQDDLGEATRRAERSLVLRREIGDVKGTLLALHNLGNFHQAAERYDRALTCFAEALQGAEAIGHRREVGATLSAMASCLTEAGRSEEAWARLLESLEVLRDLGAQDVLMDALGHAVPLLAESDGEFAYALGTWVAEHPSCLATTRAAVAARLEPVARALGSARTRRALFAGPERRGFGYTKGQVVSRALGPGSQGLSGEASVTPELVPAKRGPWPARLSPDSVGGRIARVALVA